MYCCKNCGWEYSGKYCPRCGTEFVDESESEASDVTLSSSVTVEDRLAETRRNLWFGMHCDHINTTECIRYAKELKECEADDYYANFVQIALAGSDKAMARFLNYSADNDIEMYADSVLKYLCFHMSAKLYLSVIKYKSKSLLRGSSIYDKEIEKHIPYSIRKKRERGISACVRFQKKDNGYVVKARAIWGPSGEFTIPSVFKNKPVVKIGDCAFKDCSELRSVKIPKSVISIGDCAFKDCVSLSSIEIPDSVVYLGNSVFEGCRHLSDINLSRSLTMIKSSTFYYCDSLKTITIPSSVKFIGERAFSSCSSLTSIDIPTSVISIGVNAFSCCFNLKDIFIPSSVTSIRTCAFAYCTSLKSVFLPFSITSIDYFTFSGCSSLTTIYIYGINSIGEGAFSGCTSLKDIYYIGSSSDWSKISIQENNDELKRATIHYSNRLHLFTKF